MVGWRPQRWWLWQYKWLGHGDGDDGAWPCYGGGGDGSGGATVVMGRSMIKGSKEEKEGLWESRFLYKFPTSFAHLLR